MSGADIPAPTGLQRRPLAAAPGRDRLTSTVARRPAPSARIIARRRLAVWLAKWSLPVLALALLGSIAAWPEIVRVKEHGRLALRRAFLMEAESGRMVDPRYHGADERGRPYTVTAATALQTSPERIALTAPKGDATTEAGSWLMVQAREGVFIQHEQLMDLSKDVVLYREDGTVMQTDTAAMDLKSGAAASSDLTHAEGPFGTLDAQGFTLTEKGAVIQFQGPAHLVVNSTDRK